MPSDAVTASIPELAKTSKRILSRVSAKDPATGVSTIIGTNAARLANASSFPPPVRRRTTILRVASWIQSPEADASCDQKNSLNCRFRNELNIPRTSRKDSGTERPNAATPPRFPVTSTPIASRADQTCPLAHAIATARQSTRKAILPQPTQTGLTAVPRAHPSGMQRSGGQALDQLVEDLDHFGSRLRPVGRFGDVQGCLVAASHEHVRERHHWLGADPTQLDPVRQQVPDHAEHVLLADLPPVLPAQDRRSVDEGDA